MKKHLSLYVSTFLISLLFFSCSDDDKDNKVMYVTIASEERMYDCDYIFSRYWAKIDNSNEWTTQGHIEGFEHESGNEYYLKIWREKWHDGEIADAPIHRYKLLELISKKKKDTEDIPSQYLLTTIASEKAPDDGIIPYHPYYFLNCETGKWERLVGDMNGFDYEEGYEYFISLERKFNGSNADPKFSYIYRETHSKKEKDSFGLPE